MNKILVLDLNKKKNDIFFYEYVLPVIKIIEKENKDYEVKHFLEEINFNLYKKIILCGVPIKDFTYEEYINKFNWIKNFENPIFGICAGYQVIGKIFSQKIIENEKIGIFETKKINEDIILKNIDEPIYIYKLHKKALNTDNTFFGLLKSDFDDLIKHKEKNIYASSFHPEIKNKQILVNFINI